MNQEDLLQEHIEQLENGEDVGAVAAGLLSEEAEALQLIAALRQTLAPVADEAILAAQEAQLVTAVHTQYAANNSGTAATPPLTAVILSYLRDGWAALTNNRELALGLAALVLIIAAVWLFSGRSTGNQELASDPVTSNAITKDTGSNETADAPAETNETNDETAVAAIPANSGNSIYIPILSTSLEENPQTAVIQNINGLVQIQTDGSTWQSITTASNLSARQRIRTGDLSHATLTFYDGSQAHLRANTELSIDELNALRPEDGFRTVVLTQWLGDSDHQVAHRGDNGSLYEVKTAEGSGIARGTQFHVTVLPNQLARYIVNEGKVDVSSLNKTVSVTAGQVTTLPIGSPPESPTFSISGQGQVSALGSEWTIAGQTFSTHPLTLIVGNPQVGDLVHVEGHLLDDGGRVADRIVLLRRAVTNQFSLTGEVSATGSDWTVSGQTIATTSETSISEDINIGDTVHVEGIILEDGTLQAQTILRLEAAPGLPFQFSGIVQVMNEGSWVISGQTVVLDGETAVDPEIALGDTVAARGWIRENGAWLATNITLLEDDLPTFDFTGTIQSLDPWMVAGISFTTGSWTTIAPDLSVGDAVRVRGTVLSDGTWAADSITRLNETLPNIVTFVGLVSSIDPWIVNGLPLVVTSDTAILGDIIPGMNAIVTAQLLPNGTWTVLTIRPLYPDFGQGCLIFNSPVVTVNGDMLRVKHWKLDIKRDGRIKIHGDIKINSVITLPICTGWDGSIIIIGDIVVIYQPIIVIINPGNNIPDGCRVTSKGSIKCSNKGSKRSK